MAPGICFVFYFLFYETFIGPFDTDFRDNHLGTLWKNDAVSCWNNLVTGLIVPIKLVTICQQLVNRLVTTCLQVCSNLCVFTWVNIVFKNLKYRQIIHRLDLKSALTNRNVVRLSYLKVSDVLDPF